MNDDAVSRVVVTHGRKVDHVRAYDRDGEAFGEPWRFPKGYGAIFARRLLGPLQFGHQFVAHQDRHRTTFEIKGAS